MFRNMKRGSFILEMRELRRGSFRWSKERNRYFGADITRKNMQGLTKNG